MYTLLVRGEGRAWNPRHVPQAFCPNPPTPTPVDQGPQDIPRDRGRQTGQRGLYSEMTLRGWQLPSSGARGISISGSLGAPRGAPLPCRVPRQRWGRASLSPARVMTTLTSTSSRASSQSWHPWAAARHLLPERKAPSSPPCGETGRRRGFQTCVVRVQAAPLALMWADRQAVRPSSLPARCPASGASASESRCWGFRCDRPGG